MADTMTLEQVRDELRAFCYSEHVVAPRSTVKEWVETIDAAIKQREQDKLDAARYRWLRDKSGRAGSPYIRCDHPPFKPMDYWITAGTADSCIDRAMAKESDNGR